MPSFARTRELADVVAFFEDGDPAPAEAAAPTSA
jgi:hypothetical protein